MRRGRITGCARAAHAGTVGTMANLVENIAESMSSLGVRRSYGDPVTIDGVEVIPVALSWFGFGAGTDDSTAATGGAVEAGGADEGSDAGVVSGAGGGGGGGASVPVGVYATGPDGIVRFEPNLIALLAVAIPLTWVSGKALAGVIRALKK